MKAIAHFRLFLAVFALGTIFFLSTPFSWATPCYELKDFYRDSVHPEIHVSGGPDPYVGFKCGTKWASFVESFYELYSRKFTQNPAFDFFRFVLDHTSSLQLTVDLQSDFLALSNTKGEIALALETFTNHHVFQRASSWIHETRHSVRGDPGHEICRRGRWINRKFCDHQFPRADDFQSIMSQGSFSYEVYYLKWVLRYGIGLTASDKEAIQFVLKDLAENNFNS